MGLQFPGPSKLRKTVAFETPFGGFGRCGCSGQELSKPTRCRMSCSAEERGKSKLGNQQRKDLGVSRRCQDCLILFPVPLASTSQVLKMKVIGSKNPRYSGKAKAAILPGFRASNYMSSVLVCQAPQALWPVQLRTRR